MSRSSTQAVKRTRPADFLRRKSIERKREQRAFDKQARRLVTWGRSR